MTAKVFLETKAETFCDLSDLFKSFANIMNTRDEETEVVEQRSS